MTVDERVRAALTELADDVRPEPDPYGRLRTRRRRVQRRRAVVCGAGLALVAVAAAMVPLLPHGGGQPIDGADTDPLRSANQWAEQLRLSPVRGAFGAANPDYVADVAARLAEHQRAGAFRVKAPVTEVNVIYLDDVGGALVAFAAFHLASPDPTTKWWNASGWFVARPGASAAELADPRSTAGTGDGLEPFEVMDGMEREDGTAKSTAIVGVAPVGCGVESAPVPEVDTWTPEPTGSFLVRTPDTERAEWWRVVCGGEVKYVAPARALKAPAPLTEKQVDTALRDVRGTVDRRKARETLQRMAWDGRNTAVGPASVIWAGEVAGARAGLNGSWDGDAIVTAARRVPRGWIVDLEIRYKAETSDGSLGLGWQEVMADDPTDPTTALPIRLGEGGSVLVIVPDRATTVRAVRGGTVLDTADVTGQAAVVDAAEAPDLAFEALDRDGAVVTTAKLPADPLPDPALHGW